MLGEVEAAVWLCLTPDWQVGLPQVSGDEQRRLCSDQKYGGVEQGIGIGISLTTYGSVAYQLKDANLEASGTCDFVCKALSIVNKTGGSVNI